MLQKFTFTCTLVYVKNIILSVIISKNLLIGPSQVSAFHVVQRAYNDSQEKKSTAIWQCLQTFAIFVFSLLDFHPKSPRASKLELLLTFLLLREQACFAVEKEILPTEDCCLSIASTCRCYTAPVGSPTST